MVIRISKKTDLWFEVSSTFSYYCSVLKGVFNDPSGSNSHIPPKCEMKYVNANTVEIKIFHFDTIRGDI